MVRGGLARGGRGRGEAGGDENAAIAGEGGGESLRARPAEALAHRDEMLRYADFVVSTAHALQQMQPSPPLICTLSVGACLIDPERDWNDWYAHADSALYEAKRRGGNRLQWPVDWLGAG